MLFTNFMVGRLALLESAVRGFGGDISERALYENLTDRGVTALEFAPLLNWGLVCGMLDPYRDASGWRFRVDRAPLGRLRLRANGESAPG